MEDYMRKAKGGSLKDLIEGVLPPGATLDSVEIELAPITPERLAEIRKEVREEMAREKEKSQE